ncbi:iron-siderophore ABC transporter substrate-binding protein [Kineococcus sp. SYSU DK004]|uniref:iron-siderophore ABC transporter substrate-binding protein n=1 Tax=Kineococcus sp. SYSU DK004 TaxID=3383125 RepID=UPI003D7D718B
MPFTAAVPSASSSRAPSRRGLLTGAVGAALLGAAGCAGEAPAGPVPATGAGADGPFPVIFESAFGTTEVPAAPQRVVSVGVSDADVLLALGGQPLATTGFTFYPETGLGPWAEPLLTGTPVRLGSDAEVSVEEVAALRPDLVLAVSSGLRAPLFEQLSRVAPVLARPAGTDAYAVDRAVQTRLIATALGQEEAGRRLEEDVERAFADARAAHPEFAGRTGVVALPYDGRYGVFLPGDARGQVMADLGFSLPAEVAAADTGDSFFVEVSRERLDLLEADVLVVLTDDSSRAVVEEDGVLASLDVVRRGALVLPDLDVRGAMSYGTALSVPYALDHLVPALAAAPSGP